MCTQVHGVCLPTGVILYFENLSFLVLLLKAEDLYMDPCSNKNGRSMLKYSSGRGRWKNMSVILQ